VSTTTDLESSTHSLDRQGLSNRIHLSQCYLFDTSNIASRHEIKKFPMPLRTRASDPGYDDSPPPEALMDKGLCAEDEFHTRGEKEKKKK
jgi:hypothetical protein